MTREEIITDIANLATEYNCSFEETLRGIIINDCVCGGYRQDVIERLFAPMGLEELLDAFYKKYGDG